MLEMLKNGRSGHIGGSFSCVDVLYVIYKKEILKGTGKLVYSKGHSELALYSVMEKLNILPRVDKSLKQLGSIFQGHPSKHWIKELSYSAGSLGQGLSYALGMALCNKNEYTYAILGDGELQEGQIWEAAISSVHLHVRNLIAIVDCNGYQLEGEAVVTGNSSKMLLAWKSIGWNCKIIDGHDYLSIETALSWAKKMSKLGPVAIFAETVKGKGVPFMENNVAYHGTSLPCEIIDEAIKAIQIQ